MKQFALMIAVAALVAGPAFAVESDLATTSPATDAPAAAPAKKKPKAHVAMPEDKAKDKAKTDKKTSEQKPALSKKAYVKLLAAELKRHTPKTADNQIGSVHVAFTVGASGRIVSHKVQSSSNPALEPVVGQILASVHTPPPPGGAFSAVQEFNFH
jgi:outer membrane biosynthesis protein TonB